MPYKPQPDAMTVDQFMEAEVAMYSKMYPSDELTINQTLASVTPRGEKSYRYLASSKLFTKSLDPAGNLFEVAPDTTQSLPDLAYKLMATFYNAEWIAQKVELGYNEAQVRGWLAYGAMPGDYKLPAAVK